GNVTGVTLSVDAQINGKRLELLRQALPTLKQVAVLWNSRSDVNHAALGDTERAAKALGVHLETLEIREPPDIERAFRGVVSVRAMAILYHRRCISVEPARAYRGAGGSTPSPGHVPRRRIRRGRRAHGLWSACG